MGGVVASRETALNMIVSLREEYSDAAYGWPQCQDQKVTKIRWNEKQQHRSLSEMHLGRRAVVQTLVQSLMVV